MKTLVFYILHGKCFNAQDLFIRQLAASGSDLFGLKFYAPWVMRLIKLHSDISYQPSARNHRIFLPDVDISTEAIYPESAKEPLSLQNAEHQSFSQNIEGVEAVTWVYPLASTTRAPHLRLLKPLIVQLLQDPRSALVFSPTESFLWLFIRNRIGIMTG